MYDKTVKFMLVILVALFLAAPVIATAEDAPPSLTEMWVLVPKADQGKEFWAGMKKHMAFRSENGDPRKWQAYTPLLGDQINRLAVRYCCFEWADVDTYRAWNEENPAIGEHYQEHVAPHVEKAEHYFETMSWGNSHWPMSGGPYTLFAVTDFHIKPGHGADFDSARDKMSQIALNQGWASDDHQWLWSSTIGGKTQESIIIPHENFASMERDEESFFAFLSRHMGSDAAAAELMKKFSSASWTTEFQIWEAQEEMSMKDSE